MMILWLLLLASYVFAHQNGIDCKNKMCRTMVLTPISFTSNGKKQGLNISLEGKEERWAKWKFIVPKGYPLDINISLGRPILMVNLSANVLEKNLTSETWPSPYEPTLCLTTYNPKTNLTSPEACVSIELIDCGTARNKITTSRSFFVNSLEEDMEIEVTLKRPQGEERAPAILVNKDSLSLAYIFQKERIALPDRYEPNNNPSSATVFTEMELSASIWDGILVAPIDVDWYSFMMENYRGFEIELSASEETSLLRPSLKLYDEKLKLLAQTKGVKTARIGWSGKGKFFIEVSNSAGTEGPSGHKYVLRIKR